MYSFGIFFKYQGEMTMTENEIKFFFEKDCSEVAPELIGKILIYGEKHLRITETEAYGDNDPFCYGVRYGKTVKNSVSFCKGGKVFIYADMLMFTTGKECGKPQNVLIRQAECLDDPSADCSKPNKLLQYLEPSKEKWKKLNGERIGEELLIENGDKLEPKPNTDTRVGITSSDSIIDDYIRNNCCHWSSLSDKEKEDYRKTVQNNVDIYLNKEWRFTKQK